MFCTELDTILNRIPNKRHLSISIDANARTGVRTGEKECKEVEAYGRDFRIKGSNCTSLFQFAGDNRLALVKTCFFTPKRSTSGKSNGIGSRPVDEKSTDYILTRQAHRGLVRNATVHLLPPNSPESDHSTVCA